MVFNQLSKLKYRNQKVNADVFRQLHQTKEFIDNHFNDDIHLADLVKESFISKYHFIRIFKQIFGISPYQYIIKKRLFFAKEQILKGHPIKEVALSSGFADTPSFSKAFKKNFGYTPLSLRK